MACQAGTFTGYTEDDWERDNWSGEVTFTASKYWVPDHDGPGDDALRQLVHAVVKAGEADEAIRAIGSGWAFEDIAKSDGMVVSLHELDHQLDYVVTGGAPLTQFWQDELAAPAGLGRRLVHVEAGIRIATLSELLESHGLALPTLGGSNGQALAGVISTSTHGGDWRQPPFPDLVRAVHLVTDGGRELWIERATEPLTEGDLAGILPCAETEVIRDDSVFDAAIVACGRFGVIYSFVLEVVPSFRVVGAITTPARADVLQALRDGISGGTLFQPLLDLLKRAPVPPAISADAKGEPYFFQLLFNSQRPDDVWATRRWVTTNTTDIPAPPAPLPPGAVTVTNSDGDTAVLVLEAAHVALTSAAVSAGAVGNFLGALYVTGVAIAMDVEIASRPFNLGSVVAAAVSALWRIQYGHVIPDLNHLVIDGNLKGVIAGGQRGPHSLMTSGSRADSDSNSYKSASIELVFDATTTDYLDFVQDVLTVAPSFQQAGYVSLRPSRASRGLLSMHHVSGTHAMSIEIASLQGLPGNDAWMRYVHQLAVARGGRPHWGQFNKLDAFDVATLYGDALNEWREALVRVSGASTRFSNEFCVSRGLEPTSIMRHVTAARRNGDGVVTHVCNADAAWSPVTVRQAIRDIESGTFRYFVDAAGRVVPIHVVDGRYLRSAADDTEADNLDNLPGG